MEIGILIPLLVKTLSLIDRCLCKALQVIRQVVNKIIIACSGYR